MGSCSYIFRTICWVPTANPWWLTSFEASEWLSQRSCFCVRGRAGFVESLGWSYVVENEPPRIRLANVRFLAGYRRDWLVDAPHLE